MSNEEQKIVEDIKTLIPTMSDGDGLLVQKDGNRFKILYGARKDFEKVSWSN